MLRLICRVILFTCIFLFNATQVHAVVPEIPGDGVDNGSSSGTAGSCPEGYADAAVGTGCELLLVGNDKDNDGYTTDTDCDDTNRKVYPGEYYACDCGGGPKSGTRICGGGATWGSCVCNSATPLCEATGSGVCKYVDCGSGNNSNSGTYASPYATLGKVAGGSPGSPPASPYTLAAGDVVYIIGDTNCTTRYSNGSEDVFLHITSSGTSSDKITIKRYPGSTAVLSATGGGGIKSDTGNDWVVLDDLEITLGTGAAVPPIVINVGSNDWEFSRLYIRDSSGNGDNNFSGIYMDGNNRIVSHHNFIKNISRNTGNVDNVAGIMSIQDEDVGEGDDIYSHHDVIWWDSYSDTANGRCWRNKHGGDLQDTGANGNRIEDGYCVNGRVVIGYNGSGLRGTRLFAYNDSSGNSSSNTLKILDLGEGGAEGTSAPHEDNIIQDSTFINYSMVHWARPSHTSTSQKLTFRRNIVQDNDTEYTTGNTEGVVSIDGYGSDVEHDSMVSNNALAFDNNCYYNSAATALNFCFYCVDAGGGGPGPAGNDGDNYTFATWKSTLSQDLNSYEENPTFDTYYRSTSTNCDEIGWHTLAQDAGVGPVSVKLKFRPGRGKYR